MNTATKPDTKRELDQIAQDLTDLGAAWARYGLAVGRLALETGARTLTTTARLLGDVAEGLPRPTTESPKVVVDVQAEQA